MRSSRSGSSWWLLLLPGLLATAVMAQVPVADFLGRQVTWHSARQLAAGGAATDAAPNAVFANPALLGFLRRPAAELSFGMKLATEQRTRIVYDQFENAIGEIAYADNIHASGLPGPLAGAYRYGIFAAGVGIAPVTDFGYRFTKEYRDDFYVKIGEDRVTQTGMLYNAGLGIAAQPLDQVAVGLRAGYLFGSRKLEAWQIRGSDTTFVGDEGNPSALGLGAGVAAKPFARLAVSADFQAATTLKSWRKLVWEVIPAPPEYESRYPWEAGLGLSYQAPGPLPSVVSASARYVPWGTIDSTLSSILVVRAGVEHLLLNFVRLRYGFGVEPQPFDPAIQTADIGFGVGFDVGVARIDLGALLTSDAIGPTNFWRTLAETDARVYEHRDYFSITVSREF